MVRFVTPEEIGREKWELRGLRRSFNDALRRQYQVTRNRERAERRLAFLEAELERLRSIGWVNLKAGERRYWERLRDRSIPEARERLEIWTREADRIFSLVLVPLRERIRKAEEELKEKALPKLYRVKIRLYAVKKRKDYYYLTFQGFFDVDAILDPRTGLPVWDWWLTKMEIEYAKYHFHGYWKGGIKKPKPFTVAEIGQAYLTDYTGVSTPEHLEEKTAIKYAKEVPGDIQRLARKITLREIVIGLSNIKPRPVKDVETETGVFFEYAMIIDEDGVIKWMDARMRMIWRPTEEMIDRVKKELGIK